MARPLVTPPAGPPAADTGRLTVLRRLGVAAGLTVGGILIAAAVDAWAHPLPQHVMGIWDTFAAVGAGVFALLMPSRRAVPAALLVGALIAGITASEAAQTAVDHGLSAAGAAGHRGVISLVDWVKGKTR